MNPDFSAARRHIEIARSILSVDDPAAHRLCKVFDLTLEALDKAECQKPRMNANVVWVRFPQPNLAKR